MASTEFVSGETIISADWLNEVDRTVYDVLGNPTSAAEARDSLGISEYAANIYSVFDFMTAAEIADVQARTALVDVTDALNTAFAYGANNKVTIFMPAGRYKVTDTLWVTPEGSSVLSNRIVGEGSGYGLAVAQTVIDGSSITTKPVMNIQLGRNVVLEHLYVYGPNYSNITALTVATMDYDADWIGSNADYRYAPQCGIAVDAGLGSQQANYYTGFTYRSLSSGSAYITLRNVNVWGHVVGVMVSPEGTPNANDITFDNCNINYCKHGVALGQSQSRGVSFISGSIGNCLTAYNGRTYATQQGPGMNFYGTQFGPGFELLNINAAYGITAFHGIRAESVHRIGYAGGSSSSGMPITFHGCDINLLNVSFGSTTNLVLESLSQQVLFSGCNLQYNSMTSDPSPAGFWVKSPNTTFDNCQIVVKTKHIPAIGDFFNHNYGNAITNTRVYGATESTVELLGAEGKSQTIPARVIENLSGTHVLRRGLTAIYQYVPQTTIGTYGYVSNGVAKSGDYTFSSTQLTFSVASTTNNYILVGDYLMWQMVAVGDSVYTNIGPTLRVTGVSGTDITCALLSPRKYYDETYAPNNILILMTRWAPGQALTGDTHTNTTLDNVSPTTILRNGDWLLGSADIASNTRVVSGGGTATITLSKAATGTTVGVTLYCDRLHTITTSAAF